MIGRRSLALALLAAVGALAAGCSEKAQTATPGKKADAKAWEMAQSNHVAEGWKGGDQASWEAQMRARAQAQNEYNRTVAVAAPVASAPAKAP